MTQGLLKMTHPAEIYSTSPSHPRPSPRRSRWPVRQISVRQNLLARPFVRASCDTFMLPSTRFLKRHRRRCTPTRVPCVPMSSFHRDSSGGAHRYRRDNGSPAPWKSERDCRLRAVRDKEEAGGESRSDDVEFPWRMKARGVNNSS